jgi:hypothetical protein
LRPAENPDDPSLPDAIYPYEVPLIAGDDTLVSLIVVERATDVPSSVRTIVSEPSVAASSAGVKVAVAALELIVKLPVKLTPPKSALVTPVIVYGT